MTDITDDIIDDFINDFTDDYGRYHRRYHERILVILSHEKFGALVALLLRCIDCICYRLLMYYISVWNIVVGRQD